MFEKLPAHEREAIRFFLSSPKYTKIGHNIAYDKRITEEAGFPWDGEIIDTMVLAHVVTAGDELTYALKPLSKKYLKFSDKDEKVLEDAVVVARRQAKARGYLIAGGKKEVERGEKCVFAGSKPVKADYWLVPSPRAVSDTDNDLVRDYGVGDSIRAMLLFLLWWPELENDARLMDTFRREMMLFHALRRMERRGTRVYPQHTDHLIAWYERYMAKQRAIADKSGGWITKTDKKGRTTTTRMNFNSSPQLMQKFYVERGYPISYKENNKGEERPTLGKDQLAVFGRINEETKQPKDELARAILEWRAARQTISAFLNIYKKFWYPEDWPTNRVWVLHPNYNQVGAVTGRMTCCIAQGTPIEIARNISQHPVGVPIEEVKVGDWAYCRSTTDGQLHLRQVKGVWNRGIAHKLVRLHWRSNSGGIERTGYVDMTPEHRVATSDGYVPAERLHPGQRLRTMTRGLRAGRAQIQATGNRPVYEARFVLEEVTNRSGEMLHAHHRNLNKLDNHPSNLEWKDAQRHLSYHSSGASNPRYMHWTKEEITALLERHRWSLTLAARNEGHDYACLRRHVSRFYDLVEVLRRRRELRGKIFGPPNNPYYTRNHTVVKVEPLDHTIPVYDLWIDEHTNFFAGEINVKNSDPNLQQVAATDTGLRRSEIPQRPRECFGPRPGCLWYLPDYSQIEVWVFAFLSGEEDMQQLLLSGYDFHQGVADKSFVQRPDYKERKKYYRKLAKLIMFGKLFGGGVGSEEKPGRMTKLLDMPFDQAKEFIDSFEEQFARVKSFMKDMVKRAKHEGEAWNVFGRKYRMEYDWAYKVVNYLVQGTAADVLKCAVIRLDWMLSTRYNHPQLGLINSVHDENIIEVPYELHSKQLMREIMWTMQMDSMRVLELPVPLPVGMKITSSRFLGADPRKRIARWSDTKDVKVRSEETIRYWMKKKVARPPADDKKSFDEWMEKQQSILGGFPYTTEEQSLFTDIEEHMRGCPLQTRRILEAA